MAEKRHTMTQFSQELFDTICERIADGESVRKISLDDDMPCQTTFFKWLANDEVAAQQYTRAREAQADALANDIVDIADTEADPAKARVRIDARKWMAGKLKPKVYSEKHSIEHSGPNGGPIVQQVERIIIDPKGNPDGAV